MKIFQHIFYLVILITLSSCIFKKNPIIGSWEFTESTDNDMSGLFGSDSFITFSSNETFLLVDKGYSDLIGISKVIKNAPTNEDAVYYGNWFIKDSIIHFNVENYEMNQDFRLKIISNDGKNMKLTFPKTKEENIIFKYKKDDYDDVKKSKYNFMARGLNEWRKRSDKKCSKKEIKFKVERALNFAVTFIRFHEKGRKSAIAYYLAPLPFKFYSNGIALKKQNDCEDWDNLFYDEKDAMIAYSMIESSFNNVARVPSNLSNKPIKINLFILQETLKNLRDTEVD